MEEEKKDTSFIISIPQIKKTCVKCKFGIVNPYNTFCAKYELKPKEILNGGSCEYFVSAADIINKNKKSI